MRDLRNALIKETIRRALEPDAAWRKAQAEHWDVAQIIADQYAGKAAFNGTIKTCQYAVEDGFTVGDTSISGVRNHMGKTLTVHVKNENLACRIDGKAPASLPDLLCLFDDDTRAQISNPDCKVGQSVSVVILPAPVLFRSEIGLRIFGPRYAGISPTEEWYDDQLGQA